MLPDDIVAIAGRFILKREVPREDLHRASLAARKHELSYLASTLGVAGLDFNFKLKFVDELDAYTAQEADQFFRYSDHGAPFVWPNTLWFTADNDALAARPVPALAAGDYTFSLPEAERRARLRSLFEVADGRNLDDTPPRSCGRLRLIALALAWLWHNGARENSPHTDIWRADLYWLKETFYKPPCWRV